jgi:hypothetical protein
MKDKARRALIGITPDEIRGLTVMYFFNNPGGVELILRFNIQPLRGCCYL